MTSIAYAPFWAKGLPISNQVINDSVLFDKQTSKSDGVLHKIHIRNMEYATEFEKTSNKHVYCLITEKIHYYNHGAYLCNDGFGDYFRRRRRFKSIIVTLLTDKRRERERERETFQYDPR